MPLRRIGAVVAGGGVLTGLSIVDGTVLLALLAVGAMAVGALCWVVSDRERPERLALLIRSWRGQPEPPRPPARPLSRQRAGRATPPAVTRTGPAALSE